MSVLFGESPKEAGNAAAPVREYRYLKCVKSWHPFESKRTGCGKLFTADSVISVCPECGNPLSVARLGEPARERVSRVLLEKCAKCANSAYALPCACGGKPAMPGQCVPCGCRKCCEEARAVYGRFQEGLVTLRELFAENIRKREAKEREERAKAGGQGAESKPAVPGPMAGVMERVFNDEIPF
jgi:hypothetical protein